MEAQDTVFRADALKGRVYGVTGAAHGIGRATAELLSQVGANVLAIDLDEPRLRTLKRAHASAGEILPLVADVTDTATVAAAVEKLAARFGRVDGWVNNAMFAQYGPVESQPADDMNSAWRVNVLSAWEHIRLILPHLKKAGGGSIVNLSSVMANAAAPGTTAYVATKAAVRGLTHALAVELAPHRVRVNSVAPGYVLTYSGTESKHPDPALRARETDLRRKMEEVRFRVHHPWPDYGRPEDLAHGIVFLLSDAAQFITGSCLTIDGGFSIDLHGTSERLAQGHAELSALRQELHKLGLGSSVS